MITVITGTPGAGKTLYAISKLLRALIGAKVVKTTDDGQQVEIERVIYTNIKGLLIDHVLVEAGPAWMQVKRDGVLVWEQPEGNRLGLHNWHQWAPPGAVLVVDEFQKIWPPRPNGAPVPPDIEAMDTHRHMGVDFIDISQNPNNFERNIATLCGRHLHVRRIANMHLAIVYEWDHCSRSLLYSKSISKSPWRYDKSVFKLYHSADLHTKQQRKIPALLYVVGLAVAIGAWKIPESYARITGKGEEHKKTMAQQIAPGRPGAEVKKSLPTSGGAAPLAGAAGAGLPASAPGAPGGPGSMFASPTRLFAGCGRISDICRCYDDAGRAVEVEPAICTKEVTPAYSGRPLRTGLEPGTVPAPVASVDQQAEIELANSARQLSFLKTTRGPQRSE